MNLDQAFDHYYAKKANGELSKSEIKKALIDDHGFTEANAIEVLKAISNKELHEVQNGNQRLARFLNSKHLSVFFILFSVAAMVVSVYILTGDEQAQTNVFLPWIIIAAALFMLYKHGLNIYHKSKK